MNDSDKKEFADVMTATSDLFGKKLSKIQLRIYYNSLCKYSLNDVMNALSKHIKTNKFMPKPAEIIALLPKTKSSTIINPDNLTHTVHGNGSSISYCDNTAKLLSEYG